MEKKFKTEIERFKNKSYVNKSEVQRELFERWKILGDDIKFAKQLQWKNVYYTLLLYSANIALYTIVKDILLKSTIAIITAFISIIIHKDIYKNIINYRIHHFTIENELLKYNLSKFITISSGLEYKELKYRNRVTTKTYYIPIYGIIILGAIVTIAMDFISSMFNFIFKFFQFLLYIIL